MKRLFENWNKFLKEEQPDTYEEWLSDYGISVQEYEQLKYQRQSEYGKPQEAGLNAIRVTRSGTIEAEWEDGITTVLVPKRPSYERVPH